LRRKLTDSTSSCFKKVAKDFKKRTFIPGNEDDIICSDRVQLKVEELCENQRCKKLLQSVEIKHAMQMSDDRQNQSCKISCFYCAEVQQMPVRIQILIGKKFNTYVREKYNS
jgi:hypothetical protein